MPCELLPVPPAGCRPTHAAAESKQPPWRPDAAATIARIGVCLAALALCPMPAMCAPGQGTIAAGCGGLQTTPTPSTEAHFIVTAFAIEGDDPLTEQDTQTLLAPYLGEHEGFLGLQGAAESLEELLRERGYAFHRVTIPLQRISSGRIRFVIRAYRIASINIEGAERAGDATVLASVPALVEGQTPNSRALGRSLELADTHPTRRVGITVEKAARPGYLDATLKVQEQSPQQFFSNFNNRGSQDTGISRLAIGFAQSNLFNRDHSVTLTYTTSPGHRDDVAQYGLNYSIPFYSVGGARSAFSSYSDVDSGTIAEFFQVSGNFQVSGKGKFAGLRYVQRLLPIGKFRRQAELSVEDRLFDNNVDFRGRAIGVDVRSRRLSLRYSGEWVHPNSNLGFYVAAAANLSGGNNNTTSDYERSRLGADTDWRVLRYGANADCSFSNRWLLRARFNGQYSADPLISGEQLGFGGSDSLRGYEERVLAADRGVQLSVEAWAPPIAEGLTLLSFVDTAYGKREQAQAGEARALTLAWAARSRRATGSAKVRRCEPMLLRACRSHSTTAADRRCGHRRSSTSRPITQLTAAALIRLRFAWNAAASARLPGVSDEATARPIDSQRRKP